MRCALVAAPAAAPAAAAPAPPAAAVPAIADHDFVEGGPEYKRGPYDDGTDTYHHFGDFSVDEQVMVRMGREWVMARVDAMDLATHSYTLFLYSDSSTKPNVPPHLIQDMEEPVE